MPSLIHTLGWQYLRGLPNCQPRRRTPMTALVAFIKRYPVPTYFILTFAISWGGILIVIGLVGFPATADELGALLPLAIPAMLGGPSIAGILLTGLVSGRAGFRDLLARLRMWRVGLVWYAVALLAAPLLFATVLLSLSRSSTAYLPGLLATDTKASLLLMGVVAGLMAGVFEELGWTGFAIPHLRRRYSVLSTGVMVGFLWGAWHVLANDIWASLATTGNLSLAVFITLRAVGLLLGGLVAFRVLMVWVYDRTGGSLLIAMLMHASLTATSIILGPLAIAGTPLLIYDLVSAAALWLVVAALVIGLGRQLSQPPLPKQLT
jgi:uncharacterized protein